MIVMKVMIVPEEQKKEQVYNDNYKTSDWDSNRNNENEKSNSNELENDNTFMTTRSEATQ